MVNFSSCRSATKIRGAQYRVPLSLLAILAIGTAGAGQQGAFPPKLEKYFNSAGALSRDERQQLIAGQPITKLLEAEASKEVAVLGAIWIATPMNRYVEAGRGASRIENDQTEA
jgi:hypothetical protein